MISLKQYLEEGRDAPLYHYTIDKHFESIFITNTLSGSSMHNHGSMNDILDTKSYVSLTRDKNNKIIINHIRTYNNASKDEIIIIQLSQRKLSQRYKLIPFDYFNGDSSENEAEEAIIGNIKNINKYIERIYMYKIMYNSYFRYAEKYPNRPESGIPHIFPIYDIENRNKRLN
jgi:hypothetical protein